MLPYPMQDTKQWPSTQTTAVYSQLMILGLNGPRYNGPSTGRSTDQSLPLSPFYVMLEKQLPVTIYAKLLGSVRMMVF